MSRLAIVCSRISGRRRRLARGLDFLGDRLADTREVGRQLGSPALGAGLKVADLLDDN
jgi:hypothetical protein